MAQVDHRTPAAHPPMTYALTRIDGGHSWVSSFWGYNAPKLVYDGESFYSVGFWGVSQPTSQIKVYRRQNRVWVSGFAAPDANYQPGMLLLDSRKRLILIYARLGSGPRILRSIAPGDFHHFDSIPVPAAIREAGYIGAGICRDRLVLGYIGAPATYSFNMAVLDLTSETWTGPVVMAPAQRTVEPYTTWLYPIIVPDSDDNIHLLVSNNADQSNYYNQVLYLRVSCALQRVSAPEVVAEVHPWTARLAFGQSLWVAADGGVLVAALHQPGTEVNASVLRRDPGTGHWSTHTLGSRQIMALFEAVAEPGRLQIISTHGPEIRLHASTNAADSWDRMALPDFASYGLTSTDFLHGISPASGSVMPRAPCAVFSSGELPNYETWMIEFTSPPAGAMGIDSR